MHPGKNPFQLHRQEFLNVSPSATPNSSSSLRFRFLTEQKIRISSISAVYVASYRYFPDDIAGQTTAADFEPTSLLSAQIK